MGGNLKGGQTSRKVVIISLYFVFLHVFLFFKTCVTSINMNYMYIKPIKHNNKKVYITLTRNVYI